MLPISVEAAWKQLRTLDLQKLLPSRVQKCELEEGVANDEGNVTCSAIMHSHVVFFRTDSWVCPSLRCAVGSVRMVQYSDSTWHQKLTELSDAQHRISWDVIRVDGTPAQFSSRSDTIILRRVSEVRCTQQQHNHNTTTVAHSWQYVVCVCVWRCRTTLHSLSGPQTLAVM